MDITGPPLCRRHGRQAQASPILATMALLHIAPRIEVTADRVWGSTAWVAQLLVLFSYKRSVLVDRRRQDVRITTRWFWFWNTERRVPFACVGRLIYRAQGLPSLSFTRYLSSDMWTSAFFLIAIAIKESPEDKRAHEEITLFSVWEQQPRELDWLDRLAGVRPDPPRIGDESAGAIVDVLREYLRVPIMSH
jgi:hypothetical protein